MAPSRRYRAGAGLFPLVEACYRDWKQLARYVAREINGERNQETGTLKVRKWSLKLKQWNFPSTGRCTKSNQKERDIRVDCSLLDEVKRIC